MNPSSHSFTCGMITTTGAVRKALEELFTDEGVCTIYIEKQNGDIFPVANVERYPDCPKHIYEAWIKSIVEMDYAARRK